METYFFLLLAFILDEDFFWNKIHFWSLRNVSNYTFGRWGGWRSFQVYERTIINQGAIRIVSYITLTDVGTEKKDEIPSGNVNYSRQLFCGDETMTLSRRKMLTKWKCAVEGYGGFLWVLFFPWDLRINGFVFYGNIFIMSQLINLNGGVKKLQTLIIAKVLIIADIQVCAPQVFQLPLSATNIIT